MKSRFWISHSNNLKMEFYQKIFNSMNKATMLNNKKMMQMMINNQKMTTLKKMYPSLINNLNK